jgi:hypothetical protein
VNKVVGIAALVIGLLLQPTAHADEEDAEVCLRTKVWDGYSEGWAIRTMTSATVENGATRNYLVTLYAGNEYQIQACADENSRNVDVLLYDLEGRIVARDDTQDREPSLTFTPTDTATYYVVLYAQKLAVPETGTGIGLAVTYR